MFRLIRSGSGCRSSSCSLSRTFIFASKSHEKLQVQVRLKHHGLSSGKSASTTNTHFKKFKQQSSTNLKQKTPSTPPVVAGDDNAHSNNKWLDSQENLVKLVRVFTESEQLHKRCKTLRLSPALIQETKDSFIHAVSQGNLISRQDLAVRFKSGGEKS